MPICLRSQPSCHASLKFAGYSNQQNGDILRMSNLELSQPGVNDEIYSDEQREEVRARLQRFQDEQKAINDQIRILKGRYSNQIYQIRESIMKFLDKETGTLGERITTLFREQGITIISILTALGMTLGVLIDALLGGPSMSTPTSESTTTSNKKGGAREWIKTN